MSRGTLAHCQHMATKQKTKDNAHKKKPLMNQTVVLMKAAYFLKIYQHTKFHGENFAFISEV
jgi:hypothetical protein